MYRTDDFATITSLLNKNEHKGETSSTVRSELMSSRQFKSILLIIVSES